MISNFSYVKFVLTDIGFLKTCLVCTIKREMLYDFHFFYKTDLQSHLNYPTSLKFLIEPYIKFKVPYLPPVFRQTDLSKHSTDPDQMLQKVAPDQDQHCLPLIQQFLHTPTGSKMDL